MVYFIAATELLIAGYKQSDAQSWFSFLGYSIVAYTMFKAEYNYGTQAIRYLNNDYYIDEKLLPSVLYVIGFANHVEKVDTDYESDSSQAEDVPIDEIVMITF